jgi:GGDEF domain-containing protein
MPRNLIASLEGPRIAFLGLTLVMAATWVLFAVDELSLAVAAPAALAGYGGQLILLRRLRGPAEKPLVPALEAIAKIVQRPEPGGRHLVRDEISGLYHRWYLEMRLEEEAARCDRYGYSMAVLVLRFGSVELSDIGRDSWPGRAIAAAEKCVTVVRSVDLSAYLAPNEFAICLVHCDQNGAERALERLEAELSEYSCSAGISVYPADNCSPLTMIDLARIRSRPATMEALRLREAKEADATKFA